MRNLLMGVAAVTLAATGVLAQGQGQGRGNGNPAAERGPSMQEAGERGKGKAKRDDAAAERGPAMREAAERGNDKARRGNDERPSMQAAMRDNQGRANGKPERGDDKAMGQRGNPIPGRERAAQALRDGRPIDARLERRGGRQLDDGRRIFESPDERSWFGDYERRGLIDGCPPGLAKKNPPCIPPGLAKQDAASRYRTYDPGWWGLRGLGDGRYFYDDGFLMRLDGGRVAGFIPLLGGALSLGNQWPDYYAPQPLPRYFVDYFGLGADSGYRLADNVVYRVDPQTAAITSIAALLAGDDIRVGQPMPSGYDIYNVPYGYRTQYADGPDARYRYSDGYVYRIDPATQLVTAAIELLVS